MENKTNNQGYALLIDRPENKVSITEKTSLNDSDVVQKREQSHTHHRHDHRKYSDELVGSNAQMTYFLFKSWRVMKSTYINICLGFLILSLFFERYCFITTVYKTKYYGYVLILLVIGLNCLCNILILKLRKKKQTKRLHELFQIERTPSVGKFVISFIGMIDMLYAFFLFWPANVIPIWLLITMLQFFIPFNMLVRSCCIGLIHYKVHAIAGFIIFAAVCINLLDFTTTAYQEYAYIPYALLFLLCSVFDSTSHALKESIVRSQPLDQEEFSFRISVSQFVVGLILTPAIISISQQYENYEISPLAAYQNDNFWVFFE